MKISVVVPVYNQEKYIERCLDSILAQSLEDIEVIAVDDGSTDATPEILLHYQQRDPRVTVLHQQNLYAGVARNNGLKAAQGDYVIFWDSDDYFAEDALEALYQEITKQDADICVGDATKIDVQTGAVRERCYLNWHRIPEQRPFSVQDIPQFIFNFGKNCTWNKLYKRSFLEEHGLQFSSLKQTNDVYFVLKAFVLAQKITVVDNVTVYYQFRNTDSLSGNALSKKESVLAAFLEVKGFLEESGHWENSDIRQSFLNNAFATLSFFFTMFDDYAEYKAFYDYFKGQILPALDIGIEAAGQMHSEKGAADLSDMLSCEADAYVFKQYAYYRQKNQQNKNKYLRVKSKLDKANEKNSRQQDKIANLQLAKEKKTQKILSQQEKIASQKDKLQRQKEKIQSQKEKIQRQTEKIQQQNEKIQSQQALLEKKLVKAALKIHNLSS